MFHAFIIPIENWQAGNRKPFRKFDDSFFRDPLNQTTSVWEAGEFDEFTVEVVRFFTGKKDQQNIVILSGHFDTPPTIDSAFTTARRAIGKSDEFASPIRVTWRNGQLTDHLEQISLFLRESRSLTDNEFSQLGKRSIIADAKGFCVVEDSMDAGKRAKRLCYVLALANAYQNVLDNFIDTMAAAATASSNRAEDELKRLSRFISEFYFREPVKASTIELGAFYSAYRDRQKIDTLFFEVESQLRLLADLVRFDRTEAQANREKKLQFRITLFGVILTAITIVQISPKQVLDFRTSWSNCFNNGFDECLGNTHKEESSQMSDQKKTTLKKPKTSSKSKINQE